VHSIILVALVAFAFGISSLQADPLHDAAFEGDADTVRMLIEAGADVNAKDAHGATPLHLAVANTARVLIEAGADVNAEDPYGQTPLHGAAFEGDADTAQVLIEAGADVNALTSIGDGDTPLNYAELNGHADIAKLLRDEGAEE